MSWSTTQKSNLCSLLCEDQVFKIRVWDPNHNTPGNEKRECHIFKTLVPNWKPRMRRWIDLHAIPVHIRCWSTKTSLLLAFLLNHISAPRKTELYRNDECLNTKLGTVRSSTSPWSEVGVLMTSLQKLYGYGIYGLFLKQKQFCKYNLVTILRCDSYRLGEALGP